uniref:Uncharacterized protein n=1 Tax=uncultured prokaryote TaxID=198431 RepID=A0A0H5PWQ3_9ZZZZ|nr:hypothetical protein [uncultured prokaryote]
MRFFDFFDHRPQTTRGGVVVPPLVPLLPRNHEKKHYRIKVLAQSLSALSFSFFRQLRGVSRNLLTPL